MTTDDMLRERIAKLEVEVSHLAKAVEKQTAILMQLNQAFEQAKGAKWVLLAGAGVMGFVAGKGAMILQWLGLAR